MLKWEGGQNQPPTYTENFIKDRTLSEIYYSVTCAPWCWKCVQLSSAKIWKGEEEEDEEEEEEKEKKPGSSTIWCILDVYMILSY